LIPKVSRRFVPKATDRKQSGSDQAERSKDKLASARLLPADWRLRSDKMLCNRRTVWQARFFRGNRGWLRNGDRLSASWTIHHMSGPFVASLDPLLAI
jgi:hypothetical protein